MVIGVVNKNVSFTYGDTIVPISSFTHFVRQDRDLLATPVACLRIGIGGLTNVMATQ